jgi:hypothetical protein
LRAVRRMAEQRWAENVASTAARFGVMRAPGTSAVAKQVQHTGPRRWRTRLARIAREARHARRLWNVVHVAPDWAAPDRPPRKAPGAARYRSFRCASHIAACQGIHARHCFSTCW